MNIFERFFGNVSFKSDTEIAQMRLSSKIVSDTLAMLANEIRPGITTLRLDSLAEEFIRSKGAIPAFLGLYGYPNTICTSINEEIVHAIPSHRVLREGDMLSIDCGAIMNGFYSDQAYTFAIGEVSDSIKRLITVTYQCLGFAIEEMRPYHRVGDISNAVQSHAERNGYGVVRELVGHGIGRKIHEKPQIPNHGRKATGAILLSGFVLAIEPMLTMGTYQTRKLNDNWTIVTQDGLPAAHFEHNVAIRNGKTELLSDFSDIEKTLLSRGLFIPIDFSSTEKSIIYK